jgi:SAM-dependent methyltransferase/uncharacterized damage-inducible protein DinB
MSIKNLLLSELDEEIKKTRTTLERVPADERDFTPHTKSMPLGRLAPHVAELAGFGLTVLTTPGLDFSQRSFKPLELESAEQLVRVFDEGSAKVRQALQNISDDAWEDNWRLSFQGKPIFEGSRFLAYRQMFLNHLVHHRAQLGVYLRLNEKPVPSTYGPSADDMLRFRNEGIMKQVDRSVLRTIDARLPSTSPAEIPRLLSPLSVQAWGELLLAVAPEYPHLKAFFPSMPSDDVQDSWTGSHGMVLLGQSIAFVNTLVEGYVALTGRGLEEARVLDFGCGWGRLIRLLYKYINYENIYAVDPWDQSIALCREHGIKANLALSDYVPTYLPFEVKFEAIYAFSVFTHLSEKTTHATLKTLRRYIAEDGVLVLTLRPPEYWNFHMNGVYEETMLSQLAQTGFAYTPHNRPPVDGDITFGETSISLDYLAANFRQWTLASHLINSIDPYQVVVFLRPA